MKAFPCGAWLFLVKFATQSVRTTRLWTLPTFGTSVHPPNSPQHMRSLKFGESYVFGDLPNLLILAPLLLSTSISLIVAYPLYNYANPFLKSFYP